MVTSSKSYKNIVDVLTDVLSPDSIKSVVDRVNPIKLRWVFHGSTLEREIYHDCYWKYDGIEDGTGVVHIGISTVGDTFVACLDKNRPLLFGNAVNITIDSTKLLSIDPENHRPDRVVEISADPGDVYLVPAPACLLDEISGCEMTNGDKYATPVAAMRSLCSIGNLLRYAGNCVSTVWRCVVDDSDNHDWMYQHCIGDVLSCAMMRSKYDSAYVFCAAREPTDAFPDWIEETVTKMAELDELEQVLTMRMFMGMTCESLAVLRNNPPTESGEENDIYWKAIDISGYSESVFTDTIVDEDLPF